MKTEFESLSLKGELLENLVRLNFLNMTPIQSQALPLILDGQDIIAQAKTGSGKTAAFGLGVLNTLDVTKKQTQALILCPTRELADQVSLDLKALASALNNIQIVNLCGGASLPLQEKALKSNPQIIVGTPGRVLQHLNNATLSVSEIHYFILDEADRMLEMGFQKELEAILEFLPKKKQSLLFSATYPENISQLSQSFQNSPIHIKIDTHLDENIIHQYFYEVLPSQDKNDFLYKILCKYKPERVIIFCRTKQETQNVADFLSHRKIMVECINSDLEQNERTAILTQFSNQSLSVIVGTDVLARGLDIQDLPAVFNYNLPSSAESYIHRIGRTGRAGKNGFAFSFFNPVEKEKLENIELSTKLKCDIQPIPKLEPEDKYNPIPPMRTMYISGGKKDKLRPGDIVGALIAETQITAKDIGDINIHDLFSFIAIKKDLIEKVIKKMQNGKIKKRKFKVGLV